MLINSLFVFALVGSVLAIPTSVPPLSNVDLDPTEHGLAIRSYATLSRRQLSSGDAQAVGNYASILSSAVMATTGAGGTCLGFTSEIGQIEDVCRVGLASIASAASQTSTVSQPTNTNSVVGGTAAPTQQQPTSGSSRIVLPVWTIGVTAIVGLWFA
ncbi:hypothetical protein JCM11491_005293 [Sporobolomyces phaffii]